MGWIVTAEVRRVRQTSVVCVLRVCVCVHEEGIKTDPCSPNQKALCQIRIQLVDGQRLQDA